MKRPNPLPAEKMTAVERRTELCALLALGLVRLRMRNRIELSDETGDISLHSPPDRWLHANPTHRRTA